MIKHKFDFLLCLIAVAMVSACQSTPKVGNKEPLEFDIQSMSDAGEYIYDIKTDSEDMISFDIRMSNAANDVNCKEASSFSQDSVSFAEPSTGYFGFSQMGSPHVALYEWHLCFVVDGVTYKAWRGFDPGPNSVLKVDCELSTAQLDARQTEDYFCHLDSLSINKENFGDFSLRCDSDGGNCRRFESADELSLWESLHSDPKLPEKVALAYFQYERRESRLNAGSYLSANPMPIFLSISGGDPSESFIRQLDQLGFDVHPESAWEMGKGMKVSFGDIDPISDSSLSMIVTTYCGPLCASGTTVILVLKDGAWKVASTDLNWIS